MKVTIGPYNHFIGPYQIVDNIPFLGEETREKLGDWLANTWLNDFCHWIDKIRDERQIKVRIDRWDTWSMDNTLAHIILPMLKQLKETKHGSPYVDDEDVPSHMRHGDPDSHDNWVHYKWEWVLNEMIFAFENIVDDTWEEKFVHGTPEYKHTPIEDDGMTFYTSEQINPDYWVDREGIKAYNERIHNGLKLFGKYYQGLWN